MIVIYKALLLSLVQSITEFLPISSTAHLLMTGWLIDFRLNDGNLFETVIQLATSLAVIWLYREKFLYLIRTFFSKKDSREFCYKVAIATVPSVIVGLSFYKIIKHYLYNNISIIAISLIVGGILFLLVEKKQNEDSRSEKITYKKSFFIGLFQSIAVIPGASRSGMTIIGALTNKVKRKEAVEFSFFMSIPVMFLASIFDIYKNFSNLNSTNTLIIIIGFVSTFLFTIPVVKWFIKFISNNDFKIFAYYRIIFGVIILVWKLYV